MSLKHNFILISENNNRVFPDSSFDQNINVTPHLILPLRLKKQCCQEKYPIQLKFKENCKCAKKSIDYCMHPLFCISLIHNFTWAAALRLADTSYGL